MLSTSTMRLHGDLLNISCSSKVESSNSSAFSIATTLLGVFGIALVGDRLALRFTKGCRLTVLRPRRLARLVFTPVLTRAFAGDAALEDLRGRGRFGVGPFRDSPEEALEAKEVRPSKFGVASSP